MPPTDSGAGVLFDVDGTLVDTNYLHAAAWWRAFRTHGHEVPMARLHQLIGQGSDRLVASVLGEQDEDIAEAHSRFYGPSLYELMAFSGAADLLRRCAKDGLSVVLATSASADDAGHLTAAIGADDVLRTVTTKDDAKESKPAPDIVETALARTGLDPQRCVFVGDTVWDVEAAGKAGVACVCVRTGGIAEAELTGAGAIAVYDDVATLLEQYDDSPIAALTR